MNISFPEGFLWGAALSSYQCEGGNLNTDWCAWEEKNNLEKAADACDHYHLFDQDFRSAKSLHLNSLRISFEWARINPQPGKFSKSAIEHYKEVIDSLLAYNLKPIVTLHHFTNPSWFMDQGGWLKASNIDYFSSYLKLVVETFKDKVDTWLILNEPLVYAYFGFIKGSWPPGIKSLSSAKKVVDNMLKAYTLGYDEIKSIYKNTQSQVNVSLAKNFRIFSACPDGLRLLNSFSSYLRNKIFNFDMINFLSKHKKLDFIGLNYYCREYTQFSGPLGKECQHHHQGRKNNFGSIVYPRGLYELLIKLKKYKLPIIITENGTTENQDYLYQEYLRRHLACLARAYQAGVDIRGYFWWSLMDNFEWDKGFKQRFGLLEVDYKSFKRNKRDFALVYSSIADNNKVDLDPDDTSLDADPG
tara:strand:+ start:2619 stop:3863 length:1245 start_codon:yes stop_codon:yes gene_type:complete